MNACRFDQSCQNEGRHLVRIHGVGDRRVCDHHLDWMTRMGMAFRPLGEVIVPAWRQRSLLSDRTGKLVA